MFFKNTGSAIFKATRKACSSIKINSGMNANRMFSTSCVANNTFSLTNSTTSNNGVVFSGSSMKFNNLCIRGLNQNRYVCTLYYKLINYKLL